MRFVILIMVIMVITVGLTAEILTKGTPDLNSALNEIGDSKELLRVNIVLEQQYDTDQLYEEVRGLDKKGRREYTIRTLKDFSKNTQAELEQVLTDMDKSGLVSDLRYLWITNVISLKATREALLVLDQRGDINRLTYDPMTYVLIDDEFRSEGSERYATDDTVRNIAYNIELMNIPDVWDMGYAGEGIIVAVLDTGVNYNHNDIINRMWTHPDYPNHGYNFVNNSHQTMDYHGHGTHCAGTVAGDGTSGVQTGAAPEAQIMALSVLDSGGSGEESNVWAAIQFAVDNGADVMSLSIGWRHANNPDRASWRGAMSNALSAGVIASVAAGNEGNAMGSNPIPSNLRTPGDCPPPWMHPDQTTTGGLSAVVSLGATDSQDQIASFSSIGPVSWQYVTMYSDYPYNPGMGLIKPDIVAPGVSVNSLLHSNNSGYTLKSGTSMATPGAAGVMALMLSKNHTLLPEQIAQIIEETALSMSTVKSNTFGSGRVDALLAVENVPPNMPVDPSPYEGEDNVLLFPHLSWVSEGGASAFYVSLGTDNPPSNVIDSVMTENTFFQCEDLLETATEYYWRVDAVNNNIFTEGEVWSFTTKATHISEDFETGDFSNFDWVMSSAGSYSNDWFITSEESHSGNYSTRSGSIGDSSLTSLFITLHVAEAGEFSFYRKVSTEENHDYVRFFINNTSVGEWSGELDWGYESYAIEPGIHTFRWMYMKDAANSDGEDAVWIDNVTFPELAPPPPPLVIPDNLEYSTSLDLIYLQWDMPEDPEIAEAVLLGFNVYQAIDQDDDFMQINTEVIEEFEYYVAVSTAGEHHYYVTAVFDTGESDPSEAVDVVIHPAPDNPLIEPEGGEFFQPVMVSIESDEPDVYIHYTLDESEPDTESELYNEAISIEESLTLKVRLYKYGHAPGEIVSHEYIISTFADDDVAEIVTGMKVYPNPFVLKNSSLRGSRILNIDLAVKEPADIVNVDLYNIKGQLVRSFNPQINGAHNYTLHWDLISNSGKEVGSGVYLIRMVAGDEIVNKRVMILK